MIFIFIYSVETIFIYCFRIMEKRWRIICSIILSVLLLGGILFVSSLIPVYLSDRSVNVTRSNETSMLPFKCIFHISCFLSHHFSYWCVLCHICNKSYVTRRSCCCASLDPSMRFNGKSNTEDITDRQSDLDI